jgi:hypothetical protein
MRQQGYRFSLETLPSEADSNGNGHGTGAPITSLAMPLP